MQTFLGVDLGWYGKPSGLAAIRLEDGEFHLGSVARLEAAGDILAWINEHSAASTVIGVDAPIVIPNLTGIRAGERELNRDFRRYHAGCHAANLGLPFAQNVLRFSRALADLGFRQGASMGKQEAGRFQIEIHPHAASVNLFDLPLIVKYKRGLRAERAAGLRRLRGLMMARLPALCPALHSLRLPSVPRVGNLKPAEDQIDSVLCAYIAAYWWFWGPERNHVYGNEAEGYIVVPDRQKA